MSADDRRKPGAEAVERARLAVVARDDHVRVDVARGIRHLLHVALPADLVPRSRVDLGEAAGAESLDRQQRQRYNGAADGVDAEQHGYRHAAAPGARPVGDQHRAHGRQHCEHAGGVVELRPGGEHEQHHDAESDGEEAQRLPLRPPEQPDHREHPEHGEDGSHEEHQEEPHHDADLLGVVLAEGGAHRELRPAVRHLVDHVRQGEQPGERDTAPQPARPEPSARPADRETQRDPHHEDRNEQLVERARPDHGPRREPPAPVVAQHRADREQQRCRPHHEVDARGQQHVSEDERQRRAGHAPRRECLGEPRAAHLAGDQRQQWDGCRCADERADPQRDDGVAEQPDQPLRQQGDERRLIRVSPRRRQHPEIQLVAVVAVQRREDGKHDHECSGRRDDMTDGERMPLHRRAGRGEGHVPQAIGARFVCDGHPPPEVEPSWRVPETPSSVNQACSGAPADYRGGTTAEETT